jgi:UDP-2,3-diacylglucosamine pyrophosphatase LpxH
VNMIKGHYKTIVISDVHLGTTDSKVKELVRYLKKRTCEKLILNGDIIDGWQLRKSGKWKKKHTRFFRVVLKMIEKQNTEVIYTRGNHDDFLESVVPFNIGKLSLVKDYVLVSGGKRFWVVHGDIFDSITTNFRWIAMLGDIGYTFLLWLNKIYNYWRLKRGKPYFSLSKEIKAKVKSAVSYISDFEQQLVKLARAKQYDGIICGHIHQPAIENYDGIMYMNSGDWVESLSALVEEDDGHWKIELYEDSDEASQIDKKSDLQL